MSMKSFREGFFNSVDVDALEVSKQTREYLKSNPASVALLEYASLTNDVGEQVSESCGNRLYGRICCREKPVRLKIRNICGDETIYNL